MQTCGRCRRLKNEDDFSPSYRGKPGTWCRSCFADYNRQRKYGITPPPSIPPTIVTHRCEWCGNDFLPKYDRLTQPAQFCSRDCKSRARARRLQEAIDAAKPDRLCMWCGEVMPKSMRSEAAFCSDDCNMRAHRQTRNLRRRYGAAAPQRPRSNPLINLAQFAADHDYMCHLCCEPVDMTLKHPDPMCASLDHVLPRALGGGEEIDNLQLTHLVCNLRKQHRI